MQPISRKLTANFEKSEKKIEGIKLTKFSNTILSQSAKTLRDDLKFRVTGSKNL